MIKYMHMMSFSLVLLVRGVRCASAVVTRTAAASDASSCSFSFQQGCSPTPELVMEPVLCEERLLILIHQQQHNNNKNVRADLHLGEIHARNTPGVARHGHERFYFPVPITATCIYTCNMIRAAVSYVLSTAPSPARRD